jgi:hypothetical protein
VGVAHVCCIAYTVYSSKGSILVVSHHFMFLVICRIGTVDCGCSSKSHLFCWKCLGDPHEPVSCEQWREWQDISNSMIAEAQKDSLSTDSKSAEKAANNLWLLQVGSVGRRLHCYKLLEVTKF